MTDTLVGIVFAVCFAALLLASVPRRRNTRTYNVDAVDADVVEYLPEGVIDIVYFDGVPWYKLYHDGDYAPHYERAFKTQADLYPRVPGVVYTYDTAK